MPYNSTKDLPPSVKKLSPKSQRQWMHVWNSAYGKHGDESRAFAEANSVVKKVGSKGYISGWDAEVRQFPQDAAQYNPLGATDKKGCANCNWYVPTQDACVLVAGDIVATGISRFWEAKHVYEQQPLLVSVVNWDEKSTDIPSVGAPLKQETSALSSLIAKVKSKLGWGEKGAEPTSFSLFTDNSGKLRFITSFTNNYEDSHKEILCDAAHKEYVDWVNSPEGIYPELHLFHCGEKSKYGKADFVDYNDGFVVASGLIDEDKYELAQKVAAQNPSVSHGFVGFKAQDGVWSVYRTFEISTLPKEYASNKTLDVLFEPSSKEFFGMPFEPARVEYLKGLGVSDADIASYEKNIQAQKANLAKAGVNFKSELLPDDAETGEKAKKEDDEEELDKDGKPVVKAAKKEVEFATRSELAFTVKSIGDITASLTAQSEAIGKLAEAVVSLKSDIAAVKTPIDEQVANAFAAKVAQNPTGYIASQSKTNVTEEKIEKKDEFAWMNEIVAPLESAMVVR